MKGLAAAAVTLAVAQAVVGCGAPTPAPASTTATGQVVISLEVVPRQAEFFNAQHRARVVGPDGAVVADWEITAGAAPVTVPAGSFGLEAFTVFFSDWIQCSPDPAAPGKERCEAPTLGPSQLCQARIEVAAGATVEVRFRSLAQGGCELLAIPAASDPGVPAPGSS